MSATVHRALQWSLKPQLTVGAATNNRWWVRTVSQTLEHEKHEKHQGVRLACAGAARQPPEWPGQAARTSHSAALFSALLLQSAATPLRQPAVHALHAECAIYQRRWLMHLWLPLHLYQMGSNSERSF